MSSQLILELGDIIEINSPNNILYHGHVFLIEYIDINEINLIKINKERKDKILFYLKHIKYTPL